MITSFEVGALFKIIDEASPTLRKILAQIRELNKAIDKAKVSLAELGKANLMPAGMSMALRDTQALATAWGDVAKNAGTARMAIGNASRAAVAGGSGAAGAGGANVANAVRGRRISHGGGMAHIGGPSVPIPGGSHVNVRGGAAAALGLAGYGAYEAAQMEDIVWQMIYHSGEANTPENRSKFRKVLQDSMAESGYSMHDTGKAALQEIRMFQGTPGHGVDVLPEMLRAAWIEARAKDSSLEESMKSFIGLAHMTKQYDPAAIKKLAPAFAYLSTSNPSSLSSIERSAGYAVPILQSGLDVDPLQTLLLGTALTRAGATNTKSGTWLREMAVRSMPGTAIFESTKKAEHHDELLKRLGLLNEKGEATWMVNGKPDLLRLLEIAGPALQNIPVSERAGVERKLFGAQGSGAVSLLADPAVQEQVKSLRKEMESTEFKNRYASFADAYKEGSTVQNARTAIAEFNNTMMDIGAKTLPAVNSALRDFKSILEGIRNLLPGSNPNAGQVVGSRAIEGAAAGAVTGAAIGAFGGPIGMAGGAVVGGVAGVAAGFMEAYNDKLKLGIDKGGTYTSPGKTGKPAEKIEIKPQNIQLNLNLDGKTLAQSMAEAFYTFGMQAPAADGMGQYYSGDHNFPSK